MGGVPFFVMPGTARACPNVGGSGQKMGWPSRPIGLAGWLVASLIWTDDRKQ